MSFLIFTNIVVSILKGNIDIHKYKSNHPAGNIGNNLIEIKDKIISDYPKVYKKNLFVITDLFIEMTKYKIGCIFVLNEDNRLYGVISDGDIRRFLINHINYNIYPLNNVNTSFYFETNQNKYINECQRNIFPVLDNDKNILGIVMK